MATDAQHSRTHTAYAFKRLGRKHGRFLEVGSGQIDHDRNIVHVFMDRQPIGGYTGYVVLAPHGVKPEPPPATPQRPGAAEDDEAED